MASAVRPGVDSDGAAAEVDEDCPFAPDGHSICAPLNPDESCTTTYAKTGAECSRDCQIGCGFQSLGTKYCSCSEGKYSQCPCPRPDTLMAPAEAPLCATYGAEDGLTTGLKSRPCDEEWAACVGQDPVTGTTPQGCVCMQHEVTHALLWVCGSTNKWFKMEGT
jgi:hypothetical protein